MGKLLVNLVTQCLRNSATDSDKAVKLNCDDHSRSTGSSSSSSSSSNSSSSSDDDNTMIKDKFYICIKHLSDNYLLNDKNLIYRAEGNANLVLSLPEARQVLRFRKSFVNDSIDDTTSERALNELKNFCEYTKFVTELIGETYTCQPNFVYCDINNIQHFNQWLLNYRPADRLDKEIKCHYGTLYPDVAFLPTKILPSKFNSPTQVGKYVYGLKNGFDLEIQIIKRKTILKVQTINETTCSSSCSTRNTIKTDPSEFISIEHAKNSPDIYCIEIKPKQGWQFFDDSNSETKLFKNLRYLKNFDKITKCRYCCMQYLKLCKGTIKEVSSYCPIDLFSGTSKRMHSAILGLIKSPQNNLRIFKNGQLVYGDKIRVKYFKQVVSEIFENSKLNDTNENLDTADEDVIDKKDYKLNLFIKLLTKMLLKNYINDSGKRCERYGKKYRCSSKDKCSNLSDNCALNKVLQLQLLAKSSLSEIDFFDDTKNLDEYINGILLKWKILVNESCNSVTPSPTMTRDHIRQEFQNRISISNHEEESIVGDFIARKLDKMEKYLVGATALDCSIMLTFQKLTNKNLMEIEQSDSAISNRHLIKLSHNLNFLTNITIMDLDPKSTTHYKKYLKQTELSYLSYYNYLYEN